MGRSGDGKRNILWGWPNEPIGNNEVIYIVYFKWLNCMAYSQRLIQTDFFSFIS